MATRDTFEDPSKPGGGVKWETLAGRLLYIRPESLEEKVKTVHGEKDAIRGDVTVFDGPDANTEYVDTLIFPAVLQGQLSRKLGKQVLGRLTRGSAKPGQSAPWLLEKATDADRKVGMQWLAGNLDDPWADETAGKNDTPPF